MIVEEDDDKFNENEIPNSPNATSPFRRGFRSSSSSFSRLSAVIRRSLRLPSRRSQPPLIDDDKREEEGGPRFTEHSDLRVLPYPGVPSRLDEIKELKRQNRVVKVKQLVRKANWPARHEVRRDLWKELCRDKSYDASISVYNDELKSQVLNEAKMHSPAFLKEDGVVVNTFSLTEDGTVRLIRMLALVEQLRPDIGSAPILYPLCALFMHYMTAEDAYACAQFLARRGQDTNPPVHLLMTRVQWEATPHCLLALIKKHKPNAYALLKKRAGSLDDDVIVETVRDWKKWLFAGLPLSHVVRVVDCFLVEGHKFLMRSAMAIIYMWSKIQKKTPTIVPEGKSADERISQVKEELLQTAAQCQVSTETFIEMAVMIKNLKSSTISRLQTMFEKKVRESGQSPREGGPGTYCYTNAFTSSIVSKDVAKRIMARFPSRLSLVTPELLFQLSQDGASFTHLWSKIDGADQTLLIVRTAKGEVFGAYCSASWTERNDRRERSKSKYFGTGESFVFRVRQGWNEPEIFGWVGNNNEPSEHLPQMFMTAGDKLLVIGSGDGDAIRISDELTSGMSSACSTFQSPALVDERTFIISELEVFGVTSDN